MLCLFVLKTEIMSEDVGDNCHANNPLNIDLHRDEIDDANNVYDPTPLGEIGAIRLSQGGGNKNFEVTSTTRYLIHSRGLYEGLDHEDSHEHI